MLFLSFIGFTALVAIISYLKTKNMKETSSDGYFLGGRSLTAGVIAGSLLLTNLSTEQIVGLNGSADPFSPTICSVDKLVSKRDPAITPAVKLRPPRK